MPGNLTIRNRWGQLNPHLEIYVLNFILQDCKTPCKTLHKSQEFGTYYYVSEEFGSYYSVPTSVCYFLRSTYNFFVVLLASHNYNRVPNFSAYQPKSAKVSFFKGSAKMSAKVSQIELESA